VKSIEEKKELLVIELLTSKVEAGNIPPNIPIAITRYIDFLPIIAGDARKAIIKASNIAPRADKVLIAIL
jgi:hypothetical protein